MKAFGILLYLFIATATTESLRNGTQAPQEANLRSNATVPVGGKLCSYVLKDGRFRNRYCRLQGGNIYRANRDVARAIILVHGSSLNPSVYLDTTKALAQDYGVLLNTVDIIAPHFMTQKNWAHYSVLDHRYHYWNGGNWKHGDKSNLGVSSFAVVDHIIGHLLKNRPNLEHILVAGQSAGAQFVSKYALGTDVRLRRRSDNVLVGIRFWSANAQNYMFPDSWRPFSTANCSRYNDYFRGIDKRNDYMGSLSASELLHNAIHRKIYWTVGEDDDDTVGNGCDMNQGSLRVMRWKYYCIRIRKLCERSHSQSYCKSKLSGRMRKIRNCGHGHHCSWSSIKGKSILFTEK